MAGLGVGHLAGPGFRPGDLARAVGLSASTQARGYALSRIAAGAGLLAAPALVGRLWVGSVADEPGGQAVLQALGVRDLLMGVVMLHTADAELGPSWARTCALADAVDGAATFVARRSLPATSWAATALATAGAATGLVVARGLAGA